MSTLTKNQKLHFYATTDEGYNITATVRHDDECGNGHNTFSITGTVKNHKLRGADKTERCGCIHDDIARYFPNLAPLIKWHLMSTDGPMHYVANALYFASERDHNGLVKGEKRQIRSGRTGELAWHLMAIDEDGKELDLYNLNKCKDGPVKPECKYTLEYRPWCRIGEGKTPDLKAARSAAIWPDAELEDFTEEKLTERLPKLLQDFKAAVESLGLVF